MIDPKISNVDVANFLNISLPALHKKIKVNEIEQGRLPKRNFLTPIAAREVIKPLVKPLIAALAVVKGGVGKTTLAEALGIRCALYGLRVLFVDLDQQSNLTIGLSMHEAAKNCPIMIDIVEGKAKAEEAVLKVCDGIDLVPSRLDNVTLDNYLTINRINFSKIIDKLFSSLFKQYDLVIFDCPPTLSATVCAAMLASDLVIAPVNPDVYSYEGIHIMDKEIANINEQFSKEINWRILLNRFDSKTMLSTDYITSLLNDAKFSGRLLKSVIRTSQEFPNAKKKGRSIFDTMRKHTAKEDVDTLAREIINLMK